MAVVVSQAVLLAPVEPERPLVKPEALLILQVAAHWLVLQEQMVQST
jgi:hypothetical protein